MGFHEVRFPASLSFGSVGGPERRTEIVALANGFEERNTPWRHSRRRYDAGVGMRSLDDIDTLIAFFEARSGQLHGFRWKDWADFKSCVPSAVVSATDQTVGVGDGTTNEFRLQKRYASGAEGYDRAICKPVAGTVVVAIDGAEQAEGQHWSVDAGTGVLSFTTPPADDAMITAGFEFDVPVRFDTDSLMVSVDGFQAGEIPDVPVVEVRV
ncbi:uncharacterized protein (TIGR02217 family) [Aliiruegeria haliotis]|uniref:Uncharacterized protein (TIGR02217 family) n=1 Tax=Aliiruegeria haliotis TaxID=1280846 RepID=A0A2T0RYI9_9RHOB|nr:DUF2460 domain-containing protein [Aliiruegeria haliotis]PRY26220.1 uncharacterized protein (TIGR02217 family) [Aliiruegeria haliotis]